MPNEATQSSTGDLGIDLLRAVTRLEGKVDGVDGKIDAQNSRLDRNELRQEAFDQRLHAVEKKQADEGSFKLGLQAGQSQVIGYVRFAWVAVGGVITTAVAIASPLVKAWLFH